jgi:DedD protein
MGSVILVLGAVVGLPLLFDSQPRPVAIDTPIVIPDRNQAAPLAPPVAGKSAGSKERLTSIGPDQAAPQSVKTDVANVAALDANEELVNKEGKSEVKTETKTEQKPEAKTEPKTDIKTESKADSKTDKKQEIKSDAKDGVKDASKDAAKAKALLDGKDVSKPTDAVRSVVQVGAFADAAKAKEARSKLEQAGIKTYTQEIETKEGKRIRVRVGPFASKEEADKAAEKIRKLNLPTTVLKL